MAHLYYLVEEDSTVTSSTTGVDYNDYDDHKDNDTITPLLVFETQEFTRTPSNAIAIFGTDDK